MGCDIHIYAEVKKDGKWKKVGSVFKNPWYHPEREKDLWNVPFTDEPYDDRNYDLFAILADVRNGVGFGGCITRERFNPICEPKGLPDDVSEEIQEKAEDWGCDGHSHSYFTVKELLNYDWNQTHHSIGYITLDQYIEMKETNNMPDSWSGDIDGWNIVKLSEEKADYFVNHKKLLDETKEYYVQTVFPEKNYVDCAGRFIKDTIPQLKELGNNEDVRIVFWFDN